MGARCALAAGRAPRLAEGWTELGRARLAWACWLVAQRTAGAEELLGAAHADLTGALSVDPTEAGARVYRGDVSYNRARLLRSEGRDPAPDCRAAIEDYSRMPQHLRGQRASRVAECRAWIR
jgi:hypothetical protein